MHFTVLTFLGVFIASALAAPAPTVRHVVHERRERMPRVWVKRSKVSPEIKLPMRVGLTQSNLDRGHDLLMEVYVP